MKKYFDCDGVLLNTEELLYRQYAKERKTNPNLTIGEFYQNVDWDFILSKTKPLNNSLSILKQYPSEDVSILTRIHSLKEGDLKIRFFRSHQIENNIILVPRYLKKSDVVEARGNILVDDDATNLQDWKNNDGIPIYFGEGEQRFPNIQSIDDVLDLKKVKRLFR